MKYFTNIVHVNGVYVLYTSRNPSAKYNDLSDIIGHIQFIIEEQYDTKKVFISFVDVEEKYRNQGVGKQMMIDVLRFCKIRFNANYVVLQSVTSSSKKHNLFYNMGMRYTYGFGNDPEMSGNIYKILKLNS